MSRPAVPAWLKAPVDIPTKPIVTNTVVPEALSKAPLWPAGKSKREMIDMVLGLKGRLVFETEEEGDLASQAISLIESFLSATRDHENHGRQWWAKFGGRLGAIVKQVFPEVFPKPADDAKVYEGEELVQLAEEVFGVKRCPPGSNPSGGRKFSKTFRYVAGVGLQRVAGGNLFDAGPTSG